MLGLQSSTLISTANCFPFLKNLTNINWDIRYVLQVYTGEMRDGQAEDLILTRPNQPQAHEVIISPQS